MNLEDEVAALLRPPHADVAVSYFAKATAGLGFEVKLDAGDGKGKGIFATKKFREGDRVLEEPPLVAIQHIYNGNAARACSHCFRFIGGVQGQLQNRLRHVKDFAGQDSDNGISEFGSHSCFLNFPYLSDFETLDEVPCPTGCGKAIYCSVTCRDASWGRHHSLLCLKNGTIKQGEDTDFSDLYHLSRETNDIFLLAAQLLASALLAAWSNLSIGSYANTCPLPSPEACWEALFDAWTPYSMGYKGIWWECVARPSDVPPEEETDFRESLKELARDALELFTEALKSRAPALVAAFPAALDLEVWGSIIGMFELNNLELYVPGIVPLWANRVVDADLPQEDATVLEENVALAALGGLHAILDDEEAWAIKGNAFYGLQACINHSCAPNAHAFKRDEDRNGNAIILALRDISPGDEITISYVDVNATLAERTEHLSDYGFVCSCDKCCAQRLSQELDGLLP